MGRRFFALGIEVADIRHAAGAARLGQSEIADYPICEGHEMSSLIQLQKFTVLCNGCAAILIVQHQDRDSGLICKKCGARNGNWPSYISEELLPGRNASFSELMRFSDLYNPLPHYKLGSSD